MDMVMMQLSETVSDERGAFRSLVMPNQIVHRYAVSRVMLPTSSPGRGSAPTAHSAEPS